MTKKTETEKKTESIHVRPPNLQLVVFRIKGAAPLVIHKFSQKSLNQMRMDQEAGSKKVKRAKEPRDFHADFVGAQHRSTEGWCGISAPAFRAAMISACRIVGFPMTRAKLSVFVIPDGFDKDDGTPLVRILGGDPEMHLAHARNDNGGTDLRARPMWRQWGAELKVQFDGDQFTSEDVANLLLRAGMQVGVGEGRPDSKKSLAGMGWGLFTIDNDDGAGAVE